MNAQEQCWDLLERHALASDALYRAEQAFKDEPMLETQMAHQEARDVFRQVDNEMNAFKVAHDGESFFVFRPDLVMACLSDEVKPFVFGQATNE